MHNSISVNLRYLFFITVILFTACTKNDFSGFGNNIELSADTIKFDTVFTSAGSVTKFFLIKNKNSNTLRIDNIQLMGGSASVFKMNVDGLPGAQFSNLEIEGNDSLYVFVSVNINPNNNQLPFIIRDSIQIQQNGKTIFQQLEAWGQNARYLRSQLITQNTTWNKDLPYVILGGILVDTFATLRLEEGTRVYLNADAPMIIDGQLIVNGTKKDSVVFQGNRLDEPYKNFPGSWPGIIFRESSKNNEINYAVIKNAYQGIIADKHSETNAKVKVNNTIIDNIFDIGVLGINSHLEFNNCLISNCGNNLALIYGGTYRFTHCTVSSISNNFISHKSPVVSLTNFIKRNNQIFSAALNADFTNCILWGSEGLVENEIVLEKEGVGLVNINLNHVLFRGKTDPANTIFTNVIRNQNPVFNSIDVTNKYFDFRLKKASPAVNAGTIAPLLNNNLFKLDLDGFDRKDNQPDLGCYENQD